MLRRFLQMRIANLKAELEDIKAELLAEEFYADSKGVNKDQTDFSPKTKTEYGEGLFGGGKSKDTKAKHDYNELYYEVNHAEHWDVDEFVKIKKNRDKK